MTMKNKKSFFNTICFLLFSTITQAQTNEYVPNLPKEGIQDNWHVVNRSFSRTGDAVNLNSKPGDGLLYFSDFEFGNGTIELDIKGKNDPGRSFVGVAFHIISDSTFDAVYFRPFNFKNAQRKSHSVQYISIPQYDWFQLRESFPGKYENTVQPVPNSDDWFHATIVINYPEVKVYVDHAVEPSLVVQQISTQKKGRIGFWVGNNSEGSFRNLKITTGTN